MKTETEVTTEHINNIENNAINKWFQVDGDLDDFIFFDDIQPKISER